MATAAALAAPFPYFGGKSRAAPLVWAVLGDPDVVVVGDYHLPRIVGIGLTGRALDDSEMLAELEPYRGQRGRVVRLLARAGVDRERRGPRMSVRDYRAW